MAYIIMHTFPGGTKEQYDAAIAVLHPKDGSLPPGQRFHAAGPIPGGWQVIAVYDTKEGFEDFRNNVLIPTMQKGIDGAFMAPPQETIFEAHNMQGLS